MIVIYALGGGMGHLQRARALQRALSAFDGVPSIIVANASVMPARLLQCASIRWVRGTGAAMEARLRKVLAELCPRFVVVDTFPAGVNGELERIGLLDIPHRALIKRSIVDYPIAENDWPAYSLEINVETRATSVLIREYDELLQRSCARKQLGLEGGAGRLALVAHVGYPGEMERFRSALEGVDDWLEQRNWQLRYVTPHRGAFPWPLMELFAGVDILIGAGGYHTVHEAAATGTASIHVPLERRFDSQQSRIRTHADEWHRSSTFESLASDLKAMICEMPQGKSYKQSGASGARLAAQAIAKWTDEL